MAPNGTTGPGDVEPSSAMANDGAVRVAWSRPSDPGPGDNIQGLLHLDGILATQIRCCAADTFCDGKQCFPAQWQVSLASRTDGYQIASWADAESPYVLDSFFNIALALFAPNGSLVYEFSGPAHGEWVNDPSTEPLHSDQLSPAVSFDMAGNIIVTWVGGDKLTSCATYDPQFRIFARRFS